MASFTGLKNVGKELLGYMMSHRPVPDTDLSMGLHDLENVFPGIYEKGSKLYRTGGDSKIDAEALKAIMEAKDNPDALIDIYRAVPEGVRDFNVGDWVTTSKQYAREHGKHALNGKYDIIKTKSRAADIAEPGDSIAEQGYFGPAVKGVLTKGVLPFGVATVAMLGAMGADDAQAAAVNGLASKIENMIRKRSKKDLYAGTIPDTAYNDFIGIFGNEKDVPKRVYLNGHVDSRTKDSAESYLSPYAVGRYWEDLLNGKTNGARNYPETSRTKSGDRGEAALFGGLDRLTNRRPFAPLKFSSRTMVDDNGVSQTFPVFEGKTLIETPESKLKNHLRDTNWLEETNRATDVRPTHHFSSAPDLISPGGNYSQRSRLSAGDAQSGGGTISGNGSKVNDWLLPMSLGLAGMRSDVSKPRTASESLGLGTRNVMEGLGDIASLANIPLNAINGLLGGDPEYFKNIGTVTADAMNLPKANTDSERLAGNIARGATAGLVPGGLGPNAASMSIGAMLQSLLGE